MAYTPDQVSGVLNYLKQTPEGPLRKMMVGGELTEAHFRILMKLAKGGPESDFLEAFNNETMAKLRLTPKESPLRDNFWTICKKKIVGMGLLPSETKAAA